MENNDTMICTNCGKEFNPLDVVILDNGNPGCPECGENEE